MSRTAWLAASSWMVAACAVGPDYQRPDPALPPSYPGVPATPALPTPPPSAAGPAPSSFGDLAWSAIVKDEALEDLVRTALKESWDVQIAANRVLQAEAQVRIADSFFFPTVGMSADVSRGLSIPSSLAGSAQGLVKPRTILSLTAGASWEIDFWGKVRRQDEAARAALLGAEEGRRTVLQSVILGVVQAYVQLRELDEELEISQRTLKGRRESLRLVQLRQQRGVASLVDVRQSETLIQTVERAIPQLQLQIAQQENLIHTLLGGYPGTVRRGKTLTEQALAVTVPVGLPSALLERRPDVRVSEQLLVAANAQVGVAKAAFFPSISLTASGGTMSDALSGLFSGGSWVWSIGGSLLQPLFQGGRLAASYDLASLQKEEAFLQYAQTVREAFREVADSLVALQKLREVRLAQEALVRTLADQTRLSNDRYKGGVTTYLEVLDTERQLFDQQRGLAQAQRDELLSVVALYKALGGGWQLESTVGAGGRDMLPQYLGAGEPPSPESRD